MKQWLQASAILLLMVLAPQALAVTCAQLFAEPVQGHTPTSRLTIYNESQITNGDGEYLFNQLQPATPWGNSCPGAVAPGNRCSVTGTAGPAADLFTFLTTSSSTSISPSSGTLVLGTGSYNTNQFGNISLNTGNVRFSPSYSSYRMGGITINNGYTLTLVPGDYWINGSLQINGNSRLLLAGSGLVRLFVSDNVEINDDSRINPGGIAKNLLLYAGNSLNINRGAVNAAAYSAGSARFENRSTLTGALTGRTVQLNNGSIIGAIVNDVEYGILCGNEPEPLPPELPVCPAPQAVTGGVTWTTYNTQTYRTGWSPVDAGEYDALVAARALPEWRLGSSIISEINDGGADINPHGSQQSYYLSRLTGWITAPESGVYEFAVDGDDAVELWIGGQRVTGYYGLHGSAGGPRNTMSIALQAGTHALEFRQHENTGVEGFYLYWRTPSQITAGVALQLVPASQYQTCGELMPPITPECPVVEEGIDHYSFAKSAGSPANASQYQSQVNTYGALNLAQGLTRASQINGSGNPHAVSQDRFLTRFIGYLDIPSDGSYSFAIDGDDAVELLIDGRVVVGWYGTHAACNCTTRNVTLQLAAGLHSIEFRQEEQTGVDSYRLYWRPPGTSAFEIVPASRFKRCAAQGYEWGRATLSGGRARVSFSNDYRSSVPLVFVMPTISSTDPANDGPSSVRLENITTTGFDMVQVQAPPAVPPMRAMASIDYFVTMPGRYSLGGVSYEAGRASISNWQAGIGSASWAAISYVSSWPATPAVITQLQSRNNSSSNSWVTTVARNLTTTGFDLALELSEVAQTAPVAESVGWLAGRGVGSFTLGSASYKVEMGTLQSYSGVGSTTPRSLNEQCGYLNNLQQDYGVSPILVASPSSRSDDGGWARRCRLSSTQVSMVIDEDQFADAERNHPATSFGYIALTPGAGSGYEFTLIHGSNGLTCRGEAVTLNVTEGGAPLAGFSGSVRFATSSGNGSWSLASGNGVLTNLGGGAADYLFAAADNGAVTLLLDNPRQESITISASDSVASTTGPALTFRGKGYLGAVSPAGYQLAAKPFSLQLTAISDDPARPGCEVQTDYAGSKTLALWASHDAPLPAAGLPVQMAGVNVGSSAATATTASVSFTAGVASLPVIYADSGWLTLNARDDSDLGAPPTGSVSEIISGSSRVIVNPAALVVDQVRRSDGSSNPGGSAAAGASGPSVGAGFVAASSPFNGRLRAVAWQSDSDSDLSDNPTTPSFAAAVTVLPQLHSPAAGALGILSSTGGSASGSGVLIPAVRFSSGVAALEWRYSDYGSFRFSGSASNYLQAGNSINLATSGVVGRFYPARLLLASSSLQPGNSTNPGCAMSFHYMDDAALKVQLQALAQGADGATLGNYRDGFGTLATLVWSAENNDSGVDLGGRLSGLGASWLAGEWLLDSDAVQFAKLADGSVDGPYPQLQLAVRAFGDADGADFDSRDAQPEASGDCVASSSCTARAVGVVEMRYGRLNGRNAYGSELTPLALPLWLEQWNGSRFEIASNDSCTRIDPVLLNANSQGPGNLNDIPLVGTGTTDLSHRQPVVAGLAGVVLSAPGAGNQGYLLLEIDSSSSLHFLQDKYDGSARQSLPPLHGAFGRYRGNDRIIYWRESVD
ncbi:MAG: hypothetical protein II007_08715 [Gammaproteobacteria bacterium]|nr:hypothetical protein [Gammaproteobacteria bacterium]